MMEMQSRNKHEYNRKQMQQKQVTVQEVLENYPDFVINYSERTANMSGVPMNLTPSVKEIRHDAKRLLEIFENFNDFVGDTKRLQGTHFKLMNLIFSSPFHAYLRCTAGICNVPTSSLPLFVVAISEQANCGKTFMILAALKMMTGKILAAYNKESCNSKVIKGMQAMIKGTPVFIDELDNKSLGYIRNIIKNPEKCEENGLSEMPMFIFASNECTEIEGLRPLRPENGFLSVKLC